LHTQTTKPKQKTPSQFSHFAPTSFDGYSVTTQSITITCKKRFAPLTLVGVTDAPPNGVMLHTGVPMYIVETMCKLPTNMSSVMEGGQQQPAAAGRLRFTRSIFNTAAFAAT
jgi:hypothetical protein